MLTKILSMRRHNLNEKVTHVVIDKGHFQQQTWRMHCLCHKMYLAFELWHIMHVGYFTADRSSSHLRMSTPCCVRNALYDTGLAMWGLFCSLVQILTVISTVDDLNYPEKTDTYYIVNAPYVFTACWKVYFFTKLKSVSSSWISASS